MSGIATGILGNLGEQWLIPILFGDPCVDVDWGEVAGAGITGGAFGGLFNKVAALLRAKKGLSQGSERVITLKGGKQVPASQFGGGWWNVADGGAKKTHKHIRRNIKDINAVDDINSHLGKGKQTDINLFTGKKRPESNFCSTA